jgi:hypothetical protein
MARYHVRFMNILSDDTGHQHKCVDGVIGIRRERDRERARQAAKHRFARIKIIPRWGLYADRFEMELEDQATNFQPRKLPDHNSIQAIWPH